MADEPNAKKLRFSPLFYNTTTYIGVVLSLVVLFAETLLFWIDFFAPSHNDYLGIVTYLILPPFLIIGLLLIPIGARRKQSRIRKGLDTTAPKAIHIDLTIPRHRNGFIVFLVGTVVVMLMTAIGSYRAFHYTESNRFCGAACHQIMQPEYKAHMQSPHARVNCVECHIGSGAGWYVHYKMAGVRMLFKTFQGTFQRPIPAPVETLRPAKEICMECHWPGKKISAIQLNKTYFADDPSQTPPWNIQMLMHVGKTGKGAGSGIHAHMYNDNDIYYVADDAKRQKITWVKSVAKSGAERIFTTADSPYKDKAPAPEKVRRMDCMDCHNRPAHHYEAPVSLLNQALGDNTIDPAIPMIKAKGVEALSKEYKDAAEAGEKIPAFLSAYYAKSQAAYFAANKEKVNAAAAALVAIYTSNFYPDMKSRWDAYPDNVGHLNSPGCFRCHDDEHKTKAREAISRDCTICHTITQQGAGAAMQKSTDGLEFQHPFEDDGSWRSTNCSDCHTGGG